MAKKQKCSWYLGVLLAVLAVSVTCSYAVEPTAEFTDINAGLFDLYGSSVSWGDYDDDGDLDLALAGGWSDTSQHEMTRIYRNDANVAFTYIGPSGADGASSGSVDWGDHNNDGLLDLAASGYAGGGHFWLRVYQNEDNDAFTKITGGFPPVEGDSLAWGDYDNDGDQDLAVTGGWWNRQNVPGTKIYRNDGAGVYTDIGASVADVSSSALAWGDYDKDGDLDLALSGSGAGGRVSNIYRNDGGGIFSDISAGLTPANNADLDWGDYDNDGDLDLALAGTSDSGIVTTIYENNGGVFTDISAGLTPLTSGDISWGDYDNDGDLDLVQAGSDGTNNHTVLYRNDGAGVFTSVATSLVDMVGGSVAWGDYDADGDLDLALSGNTDAGRVSKIYRNESDVANNAPNAPDGLSAILSGDDTITFSWNAATDSETPSAGLSYNICVGTTPGGCDIFSGMAEESTGLRFIAETGNAQKNLSWSLVGLDSEQTYYWSVQSIDTAFAGSGWACSVVPEPATIGLMVIGGVALLRRMRQRQTPGETGG